MARSKKLPVDSSVHTLSGKDDLFSIWEARLERVHRIWTDLQNSVKPFYKAYENIFDRLPYQSDPNYLPVPMVFSNLKFRIPQLYLKDPFIHVSARTPFSAAGPDSFSQTFPVPTNIVGQNGMPITGVRDNVVGAEIIESAINYELKHIGFKHQAKLTIMDAHFAYGVLKFGYDTEYTYDPVKGEVEKVENPDGDSREGLEWNDLVQRDSLWAKRVSPWDFRYDPDIKQLDPWLSEARWVAFRSVRPYDDVMADPIYKNKAGLEATATTKTESPNLAVRKGPANVNDHIPGMQNSVGLSSYTADIEEKYVVLWEIWDKKTRKVFVIADGHKKFLRETDWPFDMQGFPCAFLHFEDVPDNRFPLSYFQPWFEHNEAMNVLESMDIDAVKRRLNKILYTEGSITPENLQKMEMPLANQFVEVSSPEGIREIKSTPTVMDTQPIISRLQQRVYELSGVSAQQKGAQAADTTATEAKIIQSNTDARAAEALDRVREWITVSVRKMIQIMQQLFTSKRLAPIVGEEAKQWVVYSKENIQGEYDVDVELMPFNPQRSEMMVKQLTDLIALFSKVAPPGMGLSDGHGGMVGVNMARLVEELMKAMGVQVKTKEVLVPMMPPMMPPSPMGGGPPPPQGASPPSPLGNSPNANHGSGGPPLPGEGKGANKRSSLASQGVGSMMLQAMREGGQPRLPGGNQLAGSATPSRGY